MGLPPLSGELGVYNVAVALEVAAYNAVKVNGAPERHGVYGGQAVIEDDCCKGQLYVEWQRSWPSVRFPQPQGPNDLNLTDPNIRAVATYKIGIFRCSPTQDDDQNPPTSAEIDAAAQTFFKDQFALLGGVLCLLKEWDRAGAQVRWTDLEPRDEGGCAGSVLTVQIAFPVCEVCPEEA